MQLILSFFSSSQSIQSKGVHAGRVHNRRMHLDRSGSPPKASKESIKCRRGKTHGSSQYNATELAISNSLALSYSAVVMYLEPFCVAGVYPVAEASSGHAFQILVFLHRAIENGDPSQACRIRDYQASYKAPVSTGSSPASKDLQHKPYLSIPFPIPMFSCSKCSHLLLRYTALISGISSLCLSSRRSSLYPVA